MSKMMKREKYGKKDTRKMGKEKGNEEKETKT